MAALVETAPEELADLVKYGVLDQLVSLLIESGELHGRPDAASPPDGLAVPSWFSVVGDTPVSVTRRSPIPRRLSATERVALAGAGQGVTWLTASEARQLWQHARRHFEVPGRSAAVPDEEGLTYGAKLWRREQDRLLMLQTFC